MRIICLPDAGSCSNTAPAAIVPAHAARSNGRLGAAAARLSSRAAVRDLHAGSWGCHAQRDAPVQAIALPAHVEEAVAIAAFDWMCMAPQRF
jgi:hypothetical protein